MPPQLPSRSVVITGVSTGIGWATAKALVARGYRVFGSVRKNEDGERLTREFGANFVPLVFDVTDSAAITAARQQVQKALGTEGLGGLINNSGVAAGGPLLLQDPALFRRNFEVNVFGLLAVTREFAPLLGATEYPQSLPGRILNISSVAGKLAVPFMGGYVSSKHAVEGLSHVLRRELLLYGIDVIIVGPGAVNTPIWDKGDDIGPYRNTPYFKPLAGFLAYFVKEGKKGFPPEEFGEKIATIFEAEKPKTRYALVPHKFAGWVLPRWLPDRTLDKLIGKQTGLLK